LGARAIAEAIAVNEDTALTTLYGVELFEHRDLLGMSDEDGYRDSNPILGRLRERRLTERVKSARGGTR
jgi:hypothetical protein